MHLITSTKNPLIKEVKSLKERKYRDSLNKYFVEGKRIIDECCSYLDELDYILVSESFSTSCELKSIQDFCNINNKRLIFVTDKIFSELSDTKTPQGILAVMKQRINVLDSFSPSSSFVIVLDSLQDPGNLGTIIRTADAAGIDAIFLSKGSVDVYNPKVLRSTMGSIFHVPIFRYSTFNELKALLKLHNFKLITTHLNTQSNLYNTDLRDKTAIVIGNEANGVSEDILKESDCLIKIPMPGKAESLNASVAASILIYECYRQRNWHQ